MKYGYLIQNEATDSERDFLALIGKNIGVSKNIIEKYYTSPSIMLNDHFFSNFHENVLKQFGTKDEFIKKNLSGMPNQYKEIEDYLYENYSIAIFVYKIFN